MPVKSAYILSIISNMESSLLENKPVDSSGEPKGQVAGRTRKPYLTIRPSSGWQAINLRQIWQFRDLLTTLAGRDVKLRYKQTALGVVWVIIQPLMAAGIFSFVFGNVAKLPSDGVPYFIFSYAGLLGWNAFNSTLGKASSVLVANAGLISKVYFPRLVLPLSTVFSTVIDFSVALAMMAVLMVINGIVPGIGIVLVPVWLLLLIMLAVGIGLFTSALMVSYRDIAYIMPVVTNLLLYASPVAYAVSAVPESLRPYYFLNPISSILEALRWSLLGVGNVQWGYVLYSAVVITAVFIAGAFSFKRMERQFADII